MTPSILKDGLLIHRVGNDESGGPGYYSPIDSSSLIRPSHNVHVQLKTPVKSVMENHSFNRSENLSSSLLSRPTSATRPRSSSAPRSRPGTAHGHLSAGASPTPSYTYSPGGNDAFGSRIVSNGRPTSSLYEISGNN